MAELTPTGGVPSGRVYTDAMPKMTPQQSRQLAKILGKPVPDGFDKSPQDIPEDVLYELNQVKKENGDLKNLVSDMAEQMKSIKTLLEAQNAMNRPVKVASKKEKENVGIQTENS